MIKRQEIFGEEGLVIVWFYQRLFFSIRTKLSSAILHDEDEALTDYNKSFSLDFSEWTSFGSLTNTWTSTTCAWTRRTSPTTRAAPRCRSWKPSFMSSSTRPIRNSSQLSNSGRRGSPDGAIRNRKDTHSSALWLTFRRTFNVPRRILVNRGNIDKPFRIIADVPLVKQRLEKIHDWLKSDSTIMLLLLISNFWISIFSYH